MAIDVNGLKLTNDAFGHEVGDELLVHVAGLLKRVCRDDDIVGRMGGDEFIILLPQTNASEASKIKKRIVEKTETEKFDSVIVSLAIGYAVKDNNEPINDVLKVADNNMYKDKLKHGKVMRSKTIETVIETIQKKYDQEEVHTERVSNYCEAIGAAKGFNNEEIEKIKKAGILHDVGKIIVPPEILNKSGLLSKHEFEIIKRHSETSYQILKSVDEYYDFAEDVLYHHERVDGKGYPEGLKGDEIPLNSRIIAVADAYEAMTSERPYHEPMTKADAIAELRKCSGKQFDQNIVEIFINKVLKTKS
jgi:diguanylate cyclase (GGDEF)-like protein